MKCRPLSRGDSSGSPNREKAHFEPTTNLWEGLVLGPATLPARFYRLFKP